MTQRERRMAIFLLGAVALGGLFLAYQLILRPLQEYGSTIASLESDNETARTELYKIVKEKPRLERWRLMSLPIDPAHPNDVGMAKGEYGRYLNDLLYKNRFSEVTLSAVETGRAPSNLPGKKPIYVPVDFSIRSKVSLTSLVQMLEEFQRTPLMHKIKSLTIERLENAPAARRKREDLVTVQMTVEALVIGGAERRPTNLFGVDHRLLALDTLTVLERGPAAIALVPSVLSPTGPLGAKLKERREDAGPTGNSKSAPYEEVARRNYRDISRKNIFQGAPTLEKDEPTFGLPTLEDIDVTKFTYLTDITISDRRSEAWYYIRTSGGKKRYKSPGFNIFRISDEQDDQTIISGTVLKIESRDIYFSVGPNCYFIHIGENFGEALKNNRLSEAKAKALGLMASAK